ncbi:MAG: periplasmic heavy metal sensor [Candidatus Rokubacteria bacterium]|nr:periplasmic heavy metal sensor [Candidatus Rokubacteria bacterium]
MGEMMGGPSAERPLISLALQNRDQLGLTPDQVKALESLRTEFQKEATRRSADLEVAETGLAELLRADAVDLAKVETKLRQIEALRTDIRLSRVKTLEKGKALLSLEQRKKLDSLAPRASADTPGSMMAGRGMEEMQRFMNSERMPQAMSAMMEMARQMGNGDPMAGMVRMMEMMSMMGQMGGMMK